MATSVQTDVSVKEDPAATAGSSAKSLLQVEDLTTRYGPIEAVAGCLHQRGRRPDRRPYSGRTAQASPPSSPPSWAWSSPAAGQVYFQGRDVTGSEPEAMVRLGIGLVPEGRRLFKNLSVTDNLRLGAATRKDKEAAKNDLDDMFELFPILKERRGQLAGLLSGGEAQQLAIARTVMTAPRLLCLDEPSLGLAPKLVEAVFELLRRPAQAGATPSCWWSRTPCRYSSSWTEPTCCVTAESKMEAAPDPCRTKRSS